MLKIKDKTGSTIAVLKDDDSAPEITKVEKTKKEGDEEDAAVGTVQHDGTSSSEEAAG